MFSFSLPFWLKVNKLVLFSHFSPPCIIWGCLAFIDADLIRFYKHPQNAITSSFFLTFLSFYVIRGFRKEVKMKFKTKVYIQWTPFLPGVYPTISDTFRSSHLIYHTITPIKSQENNTTCNYYLKRQGRSGVVREAR